MADYQFPRSLIAGLGAVAAMPEPQVAELSGILDRAQPSLSKKKLATDAQSQFSDASVDVRKIVDSLMGLESFRAFVDEPLAAFISTLLAVPENIEPLKLDQQQLSALANRLQRLMVASSISVTGKATGVLTGHQHVFYGARVFTDIRPVFKDSDDDSSPTPLASVLVHTLRIRYGDSREAKDFYVALDEADIKILMKSLERAAKKAAQLKGVMARAKMVHLEATGE